MAFWALGRRDNRSHKLATRGSVVIEMSHPIHNDSGPDFTVYSTSTKPCSVFVSASSWTSSFHFCAYGTGNVTCDLANAGIDTTRYIKVSDANQNYELDAIETGASSAIAELPTYEIPQLNLAIQPNPFRRVTQIRWQVNANSKVGLKIYNVMGRMVKDFTSLTNNQQLKTNNNLIWDGKDNLGKQLPKGIYFIQLKIDKSELTEKIILTE
jgi:hypothetical protein